VEVFTIGGLVSGATGSLRRLGGNLGSGALHTAIDLDNDDASDSNVTGTGTSMALWPQDDASKLVGSEVPFGGDADLKTAPSLGNIPRFKACEPVGGEALGYPTVLGTGTVEVVSLLGGGTTETGAINDSATASGPTKELADAPPSNGSKV